MNNLERAVPKLNQNSHVELTKGRGFGSCVNTHTRARENSISRNPLVFNAKLPKNRGIHVTFSSEIKGRNRRDVHRNVRRAEKFGCLIKPIQKFVRHNKKRRQLQRGPICNRESNNPYWIPVQTNCNFLYSALVRSSVTRRVVSRVRLSLKCERRTRTDSIGVGCESSRFGRRCREAQTIPSYAAGFPEFIALSVA